MISDAHQPSTRNDTMKSIVAVAFMLATSTLVSTRAQAVPGQQVNYVISLKTASYNNAEYFETDAQGGGPNGPGAAQVTMHLVGTKLGWDNATPPATGEVDPLVVESYQGGPGGQNTTSDTSAALMTARNNCNGFSNAIEAQASQYLPGQPGVPLLQVDGQFLGVDSCTKGVAGSVSGLTLGLTYAPAVHTGDWDAITLDTPGVGYSSTPSTTHWDHYVVASTPAGTIDWQVGYGGNEFLSGNLTLFGYVRAQATDIVDWAPKGHTLNSSDCGTLTRDETTDPHYVLIPALKGTGIPVGCTARFEQATPEGTILGASASGMTLHTLAGVTNKASKGQWSIVEFFVDSSSTVVMRGDVE